MKHTHLIDTIDDERSRRLIDGFRTRMMAIKERLVSPEIGVDRWWMIRVIRYHRLVWPMQIILATLLLIGSIIGEVFLSYTDPWSGKCFAVLFVIICMEIPWLLMAISEVMNSPWWKTTPRIEPALLELIRQCYPKTLTCIPSVRRDGDGDTQPRIILMSGQEVVLDLDGDVFERRLSEAEAVTTQWTQATADAAMAICAELRRDPIDPLHQPLSSKKK